MVTLSKICVDSNDFQVSGTGELQIIPGSQGLQDLIVYNTSGTFVKASFPNAARLWVRAVGGGGGSAGATATAGNAIFRSGGGGGAYAERVIDISSLGASETVVVGAGGAGGAGNVAGGNGGQSSFGVLVRATGGFGSTPDQANLATPQGVQGTPNVGNVSCVGDWSTGGGGGGPAVRLSGTDGFGGAGGDSLLGLGGAAISNSGNGRSGQGFGSGPSGAVSFGGIFNGLNGADGVVLVYVYA